MSETAPAVRRQVVVDILLDYCERSHGSAPCTATGEPCFNTRGTCQDPVNWSATTKVYRFALAAGARLPGVQAWYVLDRIQIAPARLDDKRGVGGVTDVSIDFADFYHEDEGIDPYRKLRSKVMASPFFSRLLQRNPHYRGRQVLIREGVLDEYGHADVESWSTRTYYLETIRVDSSGRVRITAKDALAKLAASVMPLPVNVELAAAMDASQSTATVKTGQGANLGTAPFWIRVDDEIMKVGVRANDALSSITRAQAGTTAATHAEDEKVIRCRVWENESLDTIWSEMLEDAGVDSGDIDTAGAAAEVAYVAGGLRFTAYLSEEQSAAEWMRVLMASGNAFTWWDPVTAKVKLKTVRPRAFGEAAATITETTHIALGSVGLELLEDRAITRGWIYLAPKDWSKSLTEASNYSRRVGYIDQVEEAAYGYIKEQPPTFAPFAPASQFSEMESRIYREVSRFTRPPRRLTFDLALRDAATLGLGDDVDLTCARLVDDAGSQVSREVRVTKIAYPRDGGIKFGIEVETTEQEGKWGQWTDDIGTELTQWSDDDGYLADGQTPGWRWV